ncbi:HHL278Cp [Eremothecium sinecaudum]|uniref:HHL278Cp n=1 Tax=Eremothecium sinecaudum TaxID=45286 RepID=A0A0X8HVW7_9SACH|nr:HHL278Cp [Eremothecium sinecaudum]AMD22492.1 HHL278Cp [Eremothecium sinecaudum]
MKEERKSIWNPAFNMSSNMVTPTNSYTDANGNLNNNNSGNNQSSGGSGISLQQLPPLHRQGFRNPWSEPQSPNTTSSKRQSTFQQLPTTFEESSYGFSQSNTQFDDDDQYGRRRSSLVVPPTRAAGPDPFLYDQNFHHHGQLEMFGAHGQVQGHIHSDFGQQYVPHVSGYNSELQRRQSVAVVGSIQSQGYLDQQQQQSQQEKQHQPSTSPGLNSVQVIPPHRKLSAYPLTSNTFGASTSQIQQQLRSGSTSGQVGLVAIPQMRKVTGKQDMNPIINAKPKFRRASLHSKTISPLIALTKSLIITYTLCSDEFSYQTSKNPKRLLTKPSEGKLNNGHDNVNGDYILYVNDVLGMEQQRKYLVLDILGQGTFGQVVKCQNMLTKEIVAVKVVKSKPEYLNQSIMEAKILELLNKRIDPLNKHHFLRLHDSFVHKNHLCLVFELLSNNLYELLKQNKFHGLSMNLIKSFCKQLLDSLCVLKDSKFIHCDLKPENVLLVSPDRPELKVIDFGSACEETRTIYTYIQSRFYRAPEILMGIPYSTSIDMWSFGCIVAELFLGIPVFPGSSEFNQITRIVDMLGVPPPWMCEMGKNTYNFFKKVDPALKQWQLKTVKEYNKDFNTSEETGKQYFKWNKLDEIIRNYRISKKISGVPQLVENEMQDRECLIQFLYGVLNLSPLERWTPQQALLHPFITGQPFDKEWYPPGALPKKIIRHPSLPEGTTKELDKLHMRE